jgi:hypothetical protein
MNLSSFLNVRIFIISFAIGIFAVYLNSNAEKRKIMVFPTPDNIDEILYKDQAGTCFKFKQTQVNCPINQKDIAKVIAQ